jgi:hypothetical protein
MALSLTAGTAHAVQYDETFWPKPNIQECFGVKYALGAGIQTSAGDPQVGIRRTSISVNGGYWTWGGIYNDGTKTEESHTDNTGQWDQDHINYQYAVRVVNPFAKNNNGQPIGLLACWRNY